LEEMNRETTPKSTGLLVIALAVKNGSKLKTGSRSLSQQTLVVHKRIDTTSDKLHRSHVANKIIRKVTILVPGTTYTVVATQARITSFDHVVNTREGTVEKLTIAYKTMKWQNE
jgi:type VI protein secretion system component Hcp